MANTDYIAGVSCGLVVSLVLHLTLISSMLLDPIPVYLVLTPKKQVRLHGCSSREALTGKVSVKLY